MRGFLWSFLLPALLWAPAHAAPPEVEPHILSSIKAIWSMDFDGAEAGLELAKKAMPEYPYPYFGQANVTWVRYVYGTQRTDEALKKRFEAEVEKAIEVSKAWLKTHPKDAEGYLALSGSYGLRSRLSVIQKRWFRTLINGRRAVKMVRKAHKLDPTLHDALLGIGMYDYYADSLPRTVKFFTKLFLRGDRERGIRELKIVAEKGKYSNIAARLLLIEIYTEDRWGAKDPKEAMRIIRDLRERFPMSPIFHQVEHTCLYEDGRYDELRASAREFLKRIDEKRPYYPERSRARMRVVLGTADFAEGRLPEAEKEFREAGKLAGSGDDPNRWGVWGLVRLGQVLDAQKRRAEAVEAFKRAAAYPDIWDFRKIAKRGAKGRPTLEGGVGQLPPP